MSAAENQEATAPQSPVGKYAVTMTVYATVTVTDPEPIERVIGANGEEWRSQFYRMDSAEEVVEHFVYNAVVNREYDISRLDGWADCDGNAVVTEIDGTDFYTERLP